MGRAKIGRRSTRVAVLDRRALLRGAGACLALPWLDGMAGAASISKAPRRLVYVYVPNGVQRPLWRPAFDGAFGADNPWPATLEPLRPFAGRFSVLSGLDQATANANGDGPGDHARAAASFLTGVQARKSDGAAHLAPSADLIAAHAIGADTLVPNLALGCEDARQSGQCDSGYACAYQSHISWRSATVPEFKETSPARLFDRLFRGGDGVAGEWERSRRRSVLDHVGADLGRLRGELGTRDRAKLDEYADGLRDLERRLERVSAVHSAAPETARPPDLPADLGERTELFADLIARAFEVDATRIVSFLLTNEGSNRVYHELGLDEGHHGLSHHQMDPHKCAALAQIDRFHVQLFSTLLSRLAAVREAEGDLLGSSLVLYGSGIGDGDRHDHVDLPVLLAGGERAGLRPGRHVVHPAGTPMNDLHLALLERVGVWPRELGDGRAPLETL